MDANWLPRINQHRCTGCGDCITVCPTGALGCRDDKAHLVNPDACTYCTACEDVCPVEAIQLPFLISFSDQNDSNTTETL